MKGLREMKVTKELLIHALNRYFDHHTFSTKIIVSDLIRTKTGYRLVIVEETKKD